MRIAAVALCVATEKYLALKDFTLSLATGKHTKMFIAHGQINRNQSYQNCFEF